MSNYKDTFDEQLAAALAVSKIYQSGAYNTGTKSMPLTGGSRSSRKPLKPLKPLTPGWSIPPSQMKRQGTPIYNTNESCKSFGETKEIHIKPTSTVNRLGYTRSSTKRPPIPSTKVSNLPQTKPRTDSSTFRKIERIRNLIKQVPEKTLRRIIRGRDILLTGNMEKGLYAVKTWPEKYFSEQELQIIVEHASQLKRNTPKLTPVSKKPVIQKKRIISKTRAATKTSRKKSPLRPRGPSGRFMASPKRTQRTKGRVNSRPRGPDGRFLPRN